MKSKYTSYATIFIFLFLFFFCFQTSALTSSQHITTTSLNLQPPTPIRNPAEFEPMQGVLIRYPFGISLEIIQEMSEDVEVVTIVANTAQQTTVETQYQGYGINLSHCSFLIAPSDSYWTRDYGPWFIITGDDEQGIVDFEYNRPRPNDDQIPIEFGNANGIPVYYMDLEHTGGNYMTDGQGISISTTLVYDENPGMTPEEINQTMEDYLGIHTYHCYPDVNNEYIEHIDCWAKYLSPDTILIREVPTTHSQYDEIEASVSYFQSQNSCYGTPYNIARVYTPGNEPYTNSLILNDKVLVPITGSQWDDEALASYESAMPGYEVIGCTGSWVSTDALHCRTMGITDRYMLYIGHTPKTGIQTGEDGIEIQATIFPYSGENLLSQSTGVYYQVNESPWNFIEMTSTDDNLYTAVIPPQENNSEVRYYVHAEDYSGRKENHPYIGEPDAHTFIYKLNYTNKAPEQPTKPDGPPTGKVGVTYLFSTETTDIDGDHIFYQWDWDDGTISEWVGPYVSGDTCSVSNNWSEKGTYAVKVKAKDIYGDESPWSEPLSVSMPKTTTQSNTILDWLQQYFPVIYTLVMKLFTF